MFPSICATLPVNFGQSCYVQAEIGCLRSDDVFESLIHRRFPREDDDTLQCIDLRALGEGLADEDDGDVDVVGIEDDVAWFWTGKGLAAAKMEAEAGHTLIILGYSG